ncbi:hypothetical protein AM202_05539 [Actinobacillus minor 202]|uniref:Uncharacterized protein n=1 Tax=Actinobacillus minor 202 TaxID=591023 RepID=A0ABP2GR58_9PAST|nr:hypothetical protein AM202_05539 [Actinobacillus minor 202]
MPVLLSTMPFYQIKGGHLLHNTGKIVIFSDRMTEIRYNSVNFTGAFRTAFYFY